MSMNFGKINRAAAFDPTTAFPLDARSYFESYDAAVAAAESAQEAGSSSTVYYYGQTLVVVENNQATLYIIQPNKSLVPVGGSVNNSSIPINENQFSFDDNGKLNLLNFDSAQVGQMLVLGDDNKLKWITPIETYSKLEIDSKIAAVGHLQRIVVSDIKEIEDNYLNKADFDKYIFMAPSGLEDEANKYYEYIILEQFDTEGVSIGKAIEKIGSWEVNLSDYATQDQLNNYLEKPTDGSRLISKEEIDKLGNLSEDAEKNYINNTSEDFTVTGEGKLLLNKESVLANVVDKTNDSDLLLNATDREKLNALVLGENNDLEISGSVNVNKVEGLAEWIQDNSDLITENNYSNIDKERLESLLKITAVHPTQLSVTNDGLLSVLKIEQDQVIDLDKALASKASAVDLNTLSTTLNAYTISINSKLDDLDARLTWQSLS